MIIKKKGQGTVEYLVLLTALILTFKGGLMLFWLIAGHLWIDHQLYQYLILTRKLRYAQSFFKML